MQAWGPQAKKHRVSTRKDIGFEASVHCRQEHLRWAGYVQHTEMVPGTSRKVRPAEAYLLSRRPLLFLVLMMNLIVLFMPKAQVKVLDEVSFRSTDFSV